MAARRASWQPGVASSQDKAFAVALDLDLGQRIQIGDDLRPGAGATETCNALPQLRRQHEREQAAEDVIADSLVELVEDRTGLRVGAWRFGRSAPPSTAACSRA